MTIASLFPLAIAILMTSAFTLTVFAIFFASILRLLARQRVLEFRMAERIALVRRGLHPHTYQPLPAGDPLGPGLTGARPS